MRAAAISLIALAAAFPAAAGEIDAVSRIDAVTVYPDAAVVARVAEIDAPAGDSVLVFRDLPLGLEPASLRLEGAAGAALKSRSGIASDRANRVIRSGCSQTSQTKYRNTPRRLTQA